MSTAVDPPRPPGAAYRVFGPLVVLVAAVLASLIVYALMTAFGAGDITAGAVAGFAMGAAILGLGWGMYRRLPSHERRLLVASHVRWGKSIGIALLVALAARFAVGLITVLAELIDPSLCEKLTGLDLGETPALWQKLALAFALVVLAPLGEELVFRGFMLRGLVRVLPFGVAAVLSGVVFGAAHLQYWTVWPVLVGVAGFGIANAVIYARYGFRTAVLAHAFFNLIAAVLLFVELPEPDADRCAT